MNKFLVWAVVPISVVSMSAAAGAAEVTLIGPGGIRAAVDQMIPAFEKASGHTVKATFGSGGAPRSASSRANRSMCRSYNYHWSPWSRRATSWPRARRRSPSSPSASR